MDVYYVLEVILLILNYPFITSSVKYEKFFYDGKDYLDLRNKIGIPLCKLISKYLDLKALAKNDLFRDKQNYHWVLEDYKQLNPNEIYENIEADIYSWKKVSPNDIFLDSVDGSKWYDIFKIHLYDLKKIFLDLESIHNISVRTKRNKNISKILIIISVICLVISLMFKLIYENYSDKFTEIIIFDLNIQDWFIIIALIIVSLSLILRGWNHLLFNKLEKIYGDENKKYF